MRTYLCIVFLLSIIRSTLTSNNVDPNSNEKAGDLNKNAELVKNVQNESVRTACLLLTRNYLVGNKRSIENRISSTRPDKKKVFDKVVVSLTKNCLQNLPAEDAKKVLRRVKIYDDSSPDFSYLGYVNSGAITSTPNFDDDELNLLEFIYGNQDLTPKKEEKKKPTDKNEVLNLKEDLLTVVLSEFQINQNKYFVFGMLTTFLTCLFIFYIFGGFSRKQKTSQVQSSQSSKRR